MIKYKDWCPSVFDSKGLGLPDRQEWWVVPVIRTRDSGPREESNFSCTLKILGGEGDFVEVHRYSHWGPGWLEIVLAHPDLEEKVQELEDSLRDYPVLDEEDLSHREAEEAQKSWLDWGCKAFVRGLCDKFGVENRVFEFLEDDQELAWELYSSCTPQPYVEESGGITFFIKHAIASCRWKQTNESYTLYLEKLRCP